MNAKFVDRPGLIADRLADHFDDAEPQAKRMWTLIIQLSNLLRDQASIALNNVDLNLSRGEIMTLTCLRLSPEPHELRQNEISERVLMTSGGVTNICKKLMAAGWVVREKDPDDARASVYRLTNSGVELTNTVIPTIHGEEKRIASSLVDSELDTLCNLLERVTEKVNPKP